MLYHKEKKKLFQDFCKVFPKVKLFAGRVHEELKVQFGTWQGQEWGVHTGDKGVGQLLLPALPSCSKGETFPHCPGWWPQPALPCPWLDSLQLLHLHLAQEPEE